MAIESLHIEEFLKRSQGRLLLDVRSPGEYDHAHIPHARSLPLFTNDQRAIIGTAYKQQSREIAVNHGLDFFATHMKQMVAEFRTILEAQPAPSDSEVFIHCWRGGMRSETVAWLLNLYGYKVYVLKGGYKSFRRWALQQFERKFAFSILGGYTGSGKTEVLEKLKEMGERVIDLEALASHKGSAFGSLGLPPQPSQEMFENMLAMALSANQFSNAQEDKTSDSCRIWLEDESRHIGRIGIPSAVWALARESPLYFMEIPAEERLEFIIRQYGKFDKELLKESILHIQKRLGGLEAKNAVRFLEQGDIKSCFRILLAYYDKQYQHSLENRDEISNKITRLSFKIVTPRNAAYLSGINVTSV